jgi:hypothetical protein
MPACMERPPQLLHKGAELLEKADAELGLQKHLLKTTGAEVLDVLLLFVSVDSDVAAALDPPGGAPPLTLAQRDALMAACQADVRSAAKAAAAAAAGNNAEPVQAFVEAVEAAAEAGECMIRRSCGAHGGPMRSLGGIQPRLQPA